MKAKGLFCQVSSINKISKLNFLFFKKSNLRFVKSHQYNFSYLFNTSMHQYTMINLISLQSLKSEDNRILNSKSNEIPTIEDVVGFETNNNAVFSLTENENLKPKTVTPKAEFLNKRFTKAKRKREKRKTGKKINIRTK